MSSSRSMRNDILEEKSNPRAREEDREMSSSRSMRNDILEEETNPRAREEDREDGLKSKDEHLAISRIRGAVSVTMKAKVKFGMQELFDEYRLKYETLGIATSQSSSSSASSTSGSKQSISSSSLSSRTFLIDQFNKYRSGGKSENVKSELEKYLSEDLEDESEDFDVLLWWKVNSIRFPILSKLARDVLAVPVFTVASEAAFSTGGRVLDAFRSSLSPKIVQALICAQDWLRSNSKPISVEEDLSEIEQLDQELSKLGIESTIVDV